MSLFSRSMLDCASLMDGDHIVREQLVTRNILLVDGRRAVVGTPFVALKV